MSLVMVSNLAKNYGEVKAADNITFDAEAGKILTILGPSGSGKTTLLRCIAGLEVPESGTIKIENTLVFSSKDRIFVPPEKRQVAMVFQSYAIWPNMTVFDNIAFPLKVRKRFPQEIEGRVSAVLSLVKLEGLEKRFGTQLSAGQQQRVALARALVFNPKLLLLDEPLSNLDVKLREYMRVELKELQRRLGITTLYVTHDHTEAFALSHKIMVMNEGRNVAYGRPRELYEKPTSVFVAEFLGHTNILPARVLDRVGDHHAATARVETPFGILLFKIPTEIKEGDAFYICLRGRMINLRGSKPAVDENVIRGILRAIVYRGGDNFDYAISIDDRTINIHGKAIPDENLQEGKEVYLQIPVEACTTIHV